MGRRTNTAVWIESQQRWQIKVQKDGVRKSFYSSKPGRNGQREANAKADDWLDGNILDANCRLSKAWDIYIQRQMEGKGTSHSSQYKSFGKVWIVPTIGRIKMSALNEDHLQQVIDKAYRAGRAHKTLCDLRTAMSSFVKFCRKIKLTTLVVEDLKIPHGAPKPEKTILQPDDLVKLFTSSQSTYQRKVVEDPLINAYRLEVLTGLRPGELLGLEASDIKGREIHLRRSFNRYNEITQGKNDNSIRTVTLLDAAYQIVQEQRRIKPFGRLFGDISQQVYRKAWKRYCAFNNLTPTTPYELRHTFVSVAKTLPEGQVKPIVGHSKNMDTFGVYGHEIKGERERLAETLQSLFDEILQSENTEVG